ncbi:Glutamyl-tRNA(Gln) amidotransferase subunit A, mitochondrial [Balamuthia mandrillaris]
MSLGRGRSTTVLLRKEGGGGGGTSWLASWRRAKERRSSCWGCQPQHQRPPRLLYTTSASAREEEVVSWSMSALLERLEEGSTTAEEVVTACLKRMRQTRPLNAFISTASEEEVLLSARNSDQRRRLYRPQAEDPEGSAKIGRLEGVPIAIKDSFCTKDLPTTCASRMLKDFVPHYDAKVVEALRKQGAIILGKTNMDEFSMGSANTYSHFGPAINPHSPPGAPYVAGGSSGGSAVAVASNASFAALGADTGGSVRLPAAYCGVVGLKPSYGRVSRWGLVAFGSSLDTPGLFTKSVEDAAIMLETIAGEDPRDSTSVSREVPSYRKELRLAYENAAKDGKPLSGMRVGLPTECLVKELSQEIKEVWEEGAEKLAEMGAEVVEVSLPRTQYALPAYYILAPAEASSNLARYDGLRYGFRSSNNQSVAPSLQEVYSNTRSEGFGEEVQRRVLLGTFVLSRRLYDSYYRKAQQVRRLVLQDFEQVFESGVHAILQPTATSSAFPLDSKLEPLAMYTNDIMTIPASLAGLPAISVPFSASKKTGMPLALQLIGKYMDEVTVLRAAKALEQKLR